MFYDTHGDLVRPVRIDGEIREGYFVSIAGRVYSTRQQHGRRYVLRSFDQYHRELKLRINNVGYANFCIHTLDSSDRSTRTALVNRVVLEAFRCSPPTSQHHAGHCDDNPLNNHVDNLMWQTPQENAQQSIHRGRNCRGENSCHAKLTETEVLAIRCDHRRFKDIANQYGVSTSTISLIRLRRTWKHVI